MPHAPGNSATSRLLASIRESITQPYYLADQTGMIQDANEAFASAMAYPLQEVRGENFSTFIPENLRPFARLHHQEYFSQGHPHATEEWEYQDKIGKVRSFQVISSLLQGEGAQPLKMNILIESFSSAPADLEAFKQQSRHMFKNTLQEVSGLLQLQASQSRGEARQALAIAQQRSAIIATAFEQLYKYENPGEIELSLYLRQLLHIYKLRNDALVSHPALYLNTDKCYALGLLLNEILRAYPSLPKDIQLKGTVEGQQYTLTILHHEKRQLPKENEKNKGQLLKALQRQLKAEIQWYEESRQLLEVRVPL